MTQRPPSSRPGHDRAAAENRRKNRSKSGILLFHPRICRANPSRRGRIPTGPTRCSSAGTATSRRRPSAQPAQTAPWKVKKHEIVAESESVETLQIK